MVVIGSGYGGSIAVSRAARAGLKVCLLEKGKEWRPGDFPETELSAVGELQMTVCDEKTVMGKCLWLYLVSRPLYHVYKYRLIRFIKHSIARVWSCVMYNNKRDVKQG